MFAQRRRKQPERQNARCGDHYEPSGVQLETPARNFTVPPPVGRTCPPHHPKHLPQRPIHRGTGLVGTRITCDIIGRRRSFSTECHTFSGVELPPGGRTAQNLLALLSVVELFSLNLGFQEANRKVEQIIYSTASFSLPLALFFFCTAAVVSLFIVKQLVKVLTYRSLKIKLKFFNTKNIF